MGMGAGEGGVRAICFPVLSTSERWLQPLKTVTRGPGDMEWGQEFIHPENHRIREYQSWMVSSNSSGSQMSGCIRATWDASKNPDS